MIARAVERRPRRDNEGARLFREALKESGVSQYELAKERPGGEVDRSAIARWLYGEQKPNTANRYWLRQRFGIHILAWDNKVGQKACA